ncbi:MAG: hypothetical protein WA130_14120 [Candidatus Methanoperedens sp.]
MPEWKYTNKTVTKEEAQKSLDAVKSACFKCEKHARGCPISRTAGEIKAMMEEKS